MTKFAILGAGRQAKAAASFLLNRFTDSRIVFVDVEEANLQAALDSQASPDRVECRVLSVAEIDGPLRELVKKADCVLSCVPFFYNESLTRVAIECGTHFCDLGGNKGTVFSQLAMGDMAREAGVRIIPDCGIAPGSLNVLGEYWQNDWACKSIRLYCGGLPRYPKGILKYSLTFSPWGLFNEYFDDCEVARNGRVEVVPGLGEPELLSDLPIEGNFEAFMTSGGTSVAARLHAARGIDYQYKTIRHCGHRDIMEACREMGLFGFDERELRIGENKVKVKPVDINGQILEQTIPSDGQDLIVARVDVDGVCDGEEVTGRIDLLDYAANGFTAMERTTGFGIAIVAAAITGLYEDQDVPEGAYAPFQVINPKMLIDELVNGGVTGITVSAP